MFLNGRVLRPATLVYELPPRYRHRELLPLYAGWLAEGASLDSLLRQGAGYLESK